MGGLGFWFRTLGFGVQNLRGLGSEPQGLGFRTFGVWVQNLRVWGSSTVPLYISVGIGLDPTSGLLSLLSMHEKMHLRPPSLSKKKGPESLRGFRALPTSGLGWLRV